jgi:mono/diheme cytochrome c family protein
MKKLLHSSLQRRTAFALIITTSTIALAASGQDAVLSRYAQLAKTSDDKFVDFSADRGKAFYLAVHSEGSSETPSCSTCHTQDPRNMGQTRAGKDIAPMAVSKTPDRFTDFEKTEKWFGRNCKSVLGRECTPIEKGDFISFLSSQ